MKFVDIEVLARGGMGVVWRSRNPGLSREVAVKYISDELIGNEAAVERFFEEAMLTAQVEHKNVVRIMGTGVDTAGRPYIEMELLKGKTLKQRLIHGPLPQNVAISIARQTLAGLGHIHENNIVHGDIKPANIFLIDPETVKILDFGIAVKLTPSEQAAVMNGGTPEYVSPEQGTRKAVDQRADLYSLGIVLFEMLTGTVPFTGENPGVILEKHQREAPPELPATLCWQVRNTVACLLKKSPSERPQTVAEALTLLDGRQISKPNSSSAPSSNPNDEGNTIFGQRFDVFPTKPTPQIAPSPRPQGRFKRWALLVGTLVLIGGICGAAKLGIPLALDSHRVVNLNLRLEVGQRFRVLRKRTLTLGKDQIITYDEGNYSVDDIEPKTGAIRWKTQRVYSYVKIGEWAKDTTFPENSFGKWPTGPLEDDNAWTWSPMNLKTSSIQSGQVGRTDSGIPWKLVSIDYLNDRLIGNVEFSPPSQGIRILIEPEYIAIITDHKPALRGPNSILASLKWRITKIKDTIDASTGIPLQVDMQQEIPHAKLDIQISMKPESAL